MGRPRVMFVAGEASGDLHGSGVVRELKALIPEAEIFGIGGPKMHQAGMELLRHIDDMSFLGFVEVIRHLPLVREVMVELDQVLRRRRPDVVVLIDYPGFNLRFARRVHRRGIPILYYISPQVWAWGGNRVQKMARMVDRMAVIFPFEVEIYRSVGMNVEFVGHPLLEVVSSSLTKEEFFRRGGFDEGGPLIGLLPGSRRQEVLRLLPTMAKAVELMAQEVKGLQAGVGVSSSVDSAEVARLLEPSSNLICPLEGMTYELMRHADLLLVASGTATLESAILGTPLIILYRLAALSFLIGRALIKTPHVGLVNIVAGERVVPELIQGAARPPGVARVGLNLLNDEGRRREMRERLAQVRRKLGSAGASRRTAQIVVEMWR